MNIKSEKGFTLMELMVAIALIGILSLVGVPIYNEARETARVSADATNVRTLESVTEYWEMQSGTTTNEFLSANHDERMLKEHLVGTWVKNLPSDPWKRNREYSLTNGKWQLLGKP